MEAVIETDALEGLQALLDGFGVGLIDGSYALLLLVLVLYLPDFADEHFLGVVEIGFLPPLPLHLLLQKLLLLREVLDDRLAL